MDTVAALLLIAVVIAGAYLERIQLETSLDPFAALAKELGLA